MTDNLVQRVAQIIHRYSMPSEGCRLGVAVSGGADSVVLLHILCQLAQSLSFELMMLHVNHGLRGPESEADEEFVRQLAKVYHVPLLVEAGFVKAGNLESEARQVRRDFFHKIIQDRKLHSVALGHTQTDQAETVLFRLFRGSGPTGLAAMPLISKDRLFRPLLTTSRAEIRKFAESNGIAWRDDSSNGDLRFARNRLRLQTIPSLIRDYNSNLEGVLAGTADIIREEEACWRRIVKRTFRKFSHSNHLGVVISLNPFRKLPLALQRRVIRHAAGVVRAHLRSLNLFHIDAVLAISGSSQGHDRVIIPGLDALRSYDHLLLCEPDALRQGRSYSFEIQLGDSYQLPFGAGELKIDRIYSASQNCVNFKDEQDFLTEEVHLSDRVLAAGSLQVRNWEPGDRLLRTGHAAAEKIKTLFQDHKVLLWERRHWPVVVARNEIVWVRRFGVAADFSASGESRCKLRILYRPGRSFNESDL